MQFFSQAFRVVTFTTAMAVCVQAASLEVVGVLGNSGEAGETLVRLGSEGVIGIGVAYDESGTLWTGGANKEIKRYTVDGREVGTFKAGRMGGRNSRDKIVLVGDSLVMKLDDRVFQLPVNAEPGSEAKEFPFRANRIAFNARDGWVLAARGNEIFKFNLDGAVESVADVAEDVADIEWGPDGEIYYQQKHDLFRLDAPDEKLDKPGEKFQWLNGAWYGNAWHGTIRRYDDALKADPGVVLGGNSGSFIGYVPGNYELLNGQGMTYLGDNIYAVSGYTGTLHLLEWDPISERFEVVRRIGATRTCKALALDSAGRVWYHGGVWEWSDGPDSPLKHGIPHAGSPAAVKEQGNEPNAAMVFDNDMMVAVGPHNQDKGIVFSGELTGPARRTYITDTMKDYVAMAPVKLDRREAVLALNAQGVGKLHSISRGNGRHQGELGDVKLEAKKPISNLTSIAAADDVLWVAADGAVIQFNRNDQRWQEAQRWNGWRNDDFGKFGSRLFLSASDGRVWVSDTDRNRILVLDTATGKLTPLSGAGETDTVGDAFGLFDGPEVIAANGTRAVVYDAGNERIVKLELVP
ncbi:MAG: hypothetical protein ACQKBV_13445 [Puniceicoccales bacterium]